MSNRQTRGMRRLGMSGGMGSDCPEGFYRLKVFGFDTGQCLPSGSTAIDAAAGGVTGSVGTGVANSAATQQAATTAAGNALGQKLIALYRSNPALVIGGGLAVAALLIYGTMSFVRGK